MTASAPAHLLDGNVLVALTVPQHVHHAAARAWFLRGGSFATSPTTQGTLLRLLLRQGLNVGQALGAFNAVVSGPRHVQWLDELTYFQVDLTRVIGHHQVTDAYLAQLARSRQGRVATLDRGFALVASDVVDLVEV